MTDKKKKVVSKLPARVKGAGGGKGGGRAPVEADNTLRSSANVRVLELLSEGEIVGVVGGLKGVYFNDTQVMAEDNSLNFKGVVFDERFGTASQSPMSGFPSSEAEINVNVEVRTDNSPIRAVSDTSVDAVRITINFPNGLQKLEDSGDLNGNKVELAVDHRLVGGTWMQVGGAIVVEGKTVRAYERAFYVPRPNTGTGLWEVRVRRLTPDSTSSKDVNGSYFARMTEIQEVQLSYDDSAYVGIAVDAANVGSSIPERAYLVDGIICQVPTNYDPVSRLYTGSWDGGSFKYEWTNNPAWVLYDLLTNPRYGLGSDDLTQDQIDVWSFYRAGVYNDQLVPDGRGGNEPRFTFDAPITQRTEAIKLLQNIAGMMNANLVYSGGLITLCQDRPATAVKLVGNSNVIDGKFTRSSTAKETRYSAANVTWTNKDNRYLPEIYTLEDPAAIAMYGFNETEFAAWGATTKGQAMRKAKWALYTANQQSELITYEASLAQFNLKINDVIKIYDDRRYLTGGEGRIVSATSNTVTLDKPATITSGSKIDIVIARSDDTPGASEAMPHMVTMNVTNSPGQHTTLYLSGSFPTVPAANALYVVTGTEEARLYRVIGISQDEPEKIRVSAVTYDPAKYDYVDLGTVIDDGGGTGPGVPGAVGAPKNLQVTPITKKTDEKIIRTLNLAWDAPDSGTIVSYTVKHRKNASTYRTVSDLSVRSFDLENVEQGVYDFEVRAVGVNGKLGPAATTSYTLNLDGIGDSTLNPPTTLRVVGGGTEFYGQDLVFEFMNPSTNSAESKGTNFVAVKDFQVEICNPSGGAVLRTVTVPAVPAGAMTSWKYTFSDNNQDGGPRRSLLVKVRIRDVNNKVTAATVATLSNSAPVAVTGFTAGGMYKGNQLKWTANTEKDIQGYHIWKGTTTSFVPSAANHFYQGNGNTVLDGPLADNSTFYYKIAAYDLFNDPTDKSGNGLNITTANATTTGVPGIPDYASPPGSAAEGDKYYDTTEKALFIYKSGVWRIVGMWVGTTTQMNANTRRVTGDMWSNTTDGKMYRFNGTAWTASVPAVDITGNLTSSQIASLDVAKLSGKIGSYSTLFSGQIYGYEIAASTITGGNIAGNTITGDNIAGNTITGNKIVAGTIEAANLAASSVTAGKLAANSVSASNMQAGSITAANGAIADLSVERIKIAAGAVSTCYSTSTTGTSASMNVYVPPGARTLSIMAFYGGAMKNVSTGGDKGPPSGYQVRAPALGQVLWNGSYSFTSGVGSSAIAFADPGSDNYYLTITRSGSDSGTYMGNMTLIAIVTHK